MQSDPELTENPTVIASPALALPQTTTLDTTNGRANVGSAKCQQFVTGECLSNEDCALGCCAGLMVNGVPRGVCSNIKVGNAAGKLGCNFPHNDGALSGVCGENGVPASTLDPSAGTSIRVSAADSGTGSGAGGGQNGAQCGSTSADTAD